MKRTSSIILMSIAAVAMISCQRSAPQQSYPSSSAGDMLANARPICGARDILGTYEESFGSATCGISKPVKVYSVAGVRLDEPALVNCETAQRFNTWTKQVAIPRARAGGKTLVEYDVFASYACRPRNNRKGAKISEHATGDAIDIGGFRLSDGTYISVKDHYPSGFLKEMERGACGIFGTVLGPNYNAAHKDHLHFDTAFYEIGTYCR